MIEMIRSMGFREKSVWITAAIMVYLWYWYFDAIGASLLEGAVVRGQAIGLFIAMTIIVVVLEVVAHIILAVVSPRDADAPEDERDRLICQKAESHAAWMLGAGIITIAMATMFRDISAVAVVHWLILMLIAVEVITHVLQIVYYRRGL